MKLAAVPISAIAFVLCFLTSAASASPLLLTFDCTISGTGSGTNNCAEGAAIAQVEIAETSTTGTLIVRAKSLISGTYELKSLFLNYDGALEPGTIPGLPFVDGPGSNDYNALEFSFDDTFGTTTTLEVDIDGVDQSNYKGFDVKLCDSGNGECGFDLPTDMSYGVLGYIRSGNSYVLMPQLFDALTSDSGGVNSPDEILPLTNPCGGFVAGHLRAAVHITPAVSSGGTCLNGVSYGPYYGDGEDVSGVPPQGIPEPTTFALLGLGLVGLGWKRGRTAN